MILKDLRVVDCSSDKKRGFVVGGEPSLEQREAYVWGSINQALSMPVTRNDNIAEYASTQVLAEAFRNAGYDGIVYGSNLGVGKTVALFDLEAAAQINGALFRVAGVNLEFATAGNPYYVQQYYDGETPQRTTVPAGQTAPLSATE